MADATKKDGIELEEDVESLNGVVYDNITKINGIAIAGEGPDDHASKWIIGGGNGKVFRSVLDDAGYGTDTATTNWYQIADLGSKPNKGIAVGKDGSGNKKWVIHINDDTGNPKEIAQVQDGSEVADPVNGNTNDGSDVWDLVALSNNNDSASGGPSIAWGNDTWLGTGDDTPSDSDVLFGSPNGGTNWTVVSISAQDQNDTGRCINYKGSGDDWFMTVSDTIYTNGGDSVWTGSNWSKTACGELDTSLSHDIMAMAYDPENSRWGCVTTGGRFYTSTDDWASLEAGTNTPTATLDTTLLWVKGMVFVAGSINKWVAVGAGGRIYISSNAAGTSWSQVTHGLGSPTQLYQVATDGTTIVAVGTGTTIWASQDGSTWKNVVINGVNGANGTNFGTACWSIASDLYGAGLR